MLGINALFCDVRRDVPSELSCRWRKGDMGWFCDLEMTNLVLTDVAQGTFLRLGGASDSDEESRDLEPILLGVSVAAWPRV